MHQLVRRQNTGLAEKLLRLASTPVPECPVGEALDNSSIGNVVIAHKSASGEHSPACFFLDVYCMGVKDRFAFVSNATDCRDRCDRIREMPMGRVDAL